MVIFNDVIMQQDIIETFSNKSSINDHIKCQNTHADYVKLFNFFVHDMKFPLSNIQKSRILVAALFRKDYFLANTLVAGDIYTLDIIHQVCKILDGRRMYNQMDKKTDKIKDQDKLTKHKTFMENTKSLYDGVEISLNKRRSRFIRDGWINTRSKEILNQYLKKCLYLDSEKHKWKYLIDLLHLKPSDFKIEWFTSYVMGDKFPINSVIGECQKIDEKNILQLVKKYQLPLSMVSKKYSKLINNKILEEIVQYEDLSNILFCWDKISFPNISHIVLWRLEKGNDIDFPYRSIKTT